MEIVDIPGDRLLKSAVEVNIYKAFAFEGIPNRDSLRYVDLYGLNLDEMETMFRGTLRYKVTAISGHSHIARGPDQCS